ncbi:MAG TPA: hypothetical protein VFP43_22040, partial [Mesorhizobium sp.]|nr:hypothetical protein [Mesorhizobium sp.]
PRLLTGNDNNDPDRAGSATGKASGHKRPSGAVVTPATWRPAARALQAASWCHRSCPAVTQIAAGRPSESGAACVATTVCV